MLAAQKGAGGAEILGGAIAVGRDGLLAAVAGLLDGDALGLRDAQIQTAGTVGRVIGGALGATGAGGDGGRDFAAMNSLSLTTSSSLMLASAEPLS